MSQGESEFPTRRVIIDTDPGIDDAMAIHYAFAHPGLEVIGLTTVFGNVTTEIATRNALVLAEMADYLCIVAEGAAAPMVQAPRVPAFHVHGAEGFGDILSGTPNWTRDPRPAAQLICETIASSPGEISLIALGPLTNLSLALQENPEIVKQVAEVIIMGGALDVPGNASPYAEANIINDPHAADAVFAADWPIMLVGLDVTCQVCCNRADFAGVRAAAPDIGGFLDGAVQHYFRFHREQHNHNGCYMHDPTSLVAATDPEGFVVIKTPLRCVTEGKELGRVVRAPGSGRRKVSFCRGVDADYVRAVFLSTVHKADTCREERRKQKGKL